MDIFLALTAKISRDYAFSAFALALLMILSYWIITNKKVLSIIDTTLNKRLQQTNLYKFIRLLIIFAFTFSVIVVLLSFISPLLAKITENRSLELVVAANDKFHNKNYGEARKFYLGYLDLNPDMVGADEIRGMVTATYYGQGLHEEGLQFICSQYKKKAAGDHSYLFNIAAHLRAISVAKGAIVAETMARRFRKQCNHEDFSEFWAHIPFGMMESLRSGVLRAQHNWSLTPEGKKRLIELLAEKRKLMMSKIVANGDFVLYFTDQFDELINDIPKSSIRDSALFDAARFSSKEYTVDYLKRLVHDYPASQHYKNALIYLISTLAEQNRRDEALSYAARLKKSESMDQAAYAALSPAMAALDHLIEIGDYRAGFQLTDDICKKSTAVGLSCYQKIAFEEGKLQLALKATGSENTQATCVSAHRKLRLLMRDHEENISKPWVSGMRARLIECAPVLLEKYPELYPKALYLIASLSRRINDYETSLQYLMRFNSEIEDNDLKDDVIAELGYHKLFIEKDWPAAKAFFEKVRDNYSDRNAYDNAMWWYAKGMKEQGEYATAIAAYAEITRNTAASRFKDWSTDETAQLNRLASTAPFSGISLQSLRRDEDSELGLFIVSVTDDSPAVKILKKGDRLIRTCGKNVNAIDQVLGAIAGLSKDTACEVLYLRQSQLLQFSGAETTGWKARIRQLNPEQMQALAFGEASF